MKRPILEYRLMKSHENFEPLYHYEQIELEQILARRECEFFIKEGITYQQISSAIEDDITIIYVKKYEEDPFENVGTEEGIFLEYRELNNRKDHPLIKKEVHSWHLEILHVIGTVYHYLENMEWERDSAEIDEDRRTYVLYMKPTGFSLT
ncbi:hypothetical protein [Bacillus sp. 2205SS5-2]|uniref:hypothetical protein n=1 Tax=Bacillus sp. 2205SS5-2 TaxID=3109031 RepID=UPI0030051F6D